MDNHTVYVPSQLRDDAEGVALAYAGGCTSIPGAKGLWLSPSGILHRDDITLVQVFETGTKARDAIARMLFENGEEAVAYVTNGIPMLIESVETAVAA